MDRKINVAVIGAGRMSQRAHLPMIQRLAQEGWLEPVLLCDLDVAKAKTVASQFAFKGHTPYTDEIFTDTSIDAVYVFGTADMHYEYAAKALQSDKHVFIEKPPAPDSPSMLELVRLAARSGKVAAVGFNRRFQSNVVRAKEELRRFSRVYSLEAVFHKPAFEQAVPYGARTWLGSNGIHSLDLLNFFAGERPAELYSARGVDVRTQNFSALLCWKNGTHAVLSSNNSAGARKEAYAIHGLGLSLVCDEFDLLRHANSGAERTTFRDLLLNGGFYGEHLAFAEAIRSSQSSIHGFIDGFVALRLVELIEEGHRGTISWPDEESGHSAGRPVPAMSARAADERPLVLILSPLGPHLAKLAQSYEPVFGEAFPTLPDEKKKRIVAMITGRGGRAPEPAWLDEMPGLKVLGVVGASVKRFQAAAFLERKVPVINVADVYAETVAEFALMQMIAGVRGAVVSHEAMRAGGWGYDRARLAAKKSIKVAARLKQLVKRLVYGVVGESDAAKALIHRLARRGGQRAPESRGTRPQHMVRSFRGASVGLIGWGAISRKVVEYVKPFGCNVKVVSEYLTLEEAARLGVAKCDMGEALRCDVVSLHRGLSDRTQRSFGAAEFAWLKPGAVFVNTARAGLVDPEALLARLRQGDIFACLDVYDQEPLPAEHELRRLPNVFLTSHIAGSTAQMYEKAAATLIERVKQHLAGDTVPQLIDTDELLSNMT